VKIKINDNIKKFKFLKLSSEKIKNKLITNMSFLPNASNSDIGYRNKIGEKTINNQKKLIFIFDNK
tara:strand:- start:372 stop:569 length:198 start_codon:yes stop_codon:yes gene_type:complete